MANLCFKASYFHGLDATQIYNFVHITLFDELKKKNLLSSIPEAREDTVQKV